MYNLCVTVYCLTP